MLGSLTSGPARHWPFRSRLRQPRSLLMSLTNPPNTTTTDAEITQLQNGIQFKSTSDAAAVAAKVNDPNSGQTVFIYASGLISGATNTSQTAVGVWSLMTSATPTVVDLTSLSTIFLPSQSANAVKFGFTDVTSYVTEALGFSLSTLPAFGQFTSMSNAAFAQSLSTLLSVNIGPINDFITTLDRLLHRKSHRSKTGRNHADAPAGGLRRHIW